ncbi:hypothetical protein HMPREF0326_01801 [Desulfovibrio sp. 3_1_syn3]|mgnify:CR=1 FL=1|uniref:restriction endonuclease subunit M n=1 Tax=Desulfovibrio sp. 3_1_syn3 TaxID=457398 RepID=UPI0002EC09DD|nr:N-6 DNA methylase [Desulfovibrio sp. 3_1_syn3]EFL86098.2 hypothetical protein HMPREF0326_01801 [Desulfovibrio sp. 3_1_syn3]
MTKLSTNEREWYYAAIDKFGGAAVAINRSNDTVTYNQRIKSDESHTKQADPEELAHALMVCMLNSDKYKYKLENIEHEIHFAHGSKGSMSDEVDIIINDDDGLPYAIVELKSASEYLSSKTDAIKNQLFGTAPLVGSPKLLVYATIEPKNIPKITSICIDYTRYKSYDGWISEGEPHSDQFPVDYQDIDYTPYTNQGAKDLEMDSNLSDFRAIALSFHNEFFGEHPDNILFMNLVKCLLAKIHDERTCKKDKPYAFQIFHKNGRPENSIEVFERINKLYTQSYQRYIDSSEGDEINSKEFPEERVKSVVQALQGISITKGAARHGDIIGAFFEEILRSGFKQDRGMYFTHDNLVRFMVEAVGLSTLTEVVWKKSNHPDNRIPYIIDPACGSGTFLLHAMNTITNTIKKSEEKLVIDHDSEQFYRARLSNEQPNYWAENFIYGFDPKFIMAITAKVNMVLHGDGSAHIYKEDAFKSFSLYNDVRLRPCSDSQRSVPRANYSQDVCETFDVVISNPPFGITLPIESQRTLAKTFLLSNSTPSEGLFIERCFQLLKQKGRLALVLPESLLNAKEMVDVRRFIFRFFNIKSIVSLPRNIFIDTPTLTSLLFAQKKTAEEISLWDKEWDKYNAIVEQKVKQASQMLNKKISSKYSGEKLSEMFLKELYPIIKDDDWIIKGGKNPAIIKIGKENLGGMNGQEVASYYKDVLKTAGFKSSTMSYIFEKVSESFDYKYPVFMVDEVGYKLSKRKEKSRPNQLCLFKGVNSNSVITNLHLAQECEILINSESPKTVLDMLSTNIVWD